MKTKILITIAGGLVQSVCSNDNNVDIVIIDEDDNGDGINISDVLHPDSVVDDLYTLFTDANSPKDMEIRDKLKHNKF